MYKSKVWQLLAISLALLPFSIHAQPATRVVAPAPPELQKLEEGETPTQKQQSKKNSITDKREQGRVSTTEVQQNGNTYYVKSPSQAGTLTPEDGPPRGAQWQVMEFDLGQKKKTDNPDSTSTPDHPPPTVSHPKTK